MLVCIQQYSAEKEQRRAPGVRRKGKKRLRPSAAASREACCQHTDGELREVKASVLLARAGI